MTIVLVCTIIAMAIVIAYLLINRGLDRQIVKTAVDSAEKARQLTYKQNGLNAELKRQLNNLRDLNEKYFKFEKNFNPDVMKIKIDFNDPDATARELVAMHMLAMPLLSEKYEMPMAKLKGASRHAAMISLNFLSNIMDFDEFFCKVMKSLQYGSYLEDEAERVEIGLADQPIDTGYKDNHNNPIMFPGHVQTYHKNEMRQHRIVRRLKRIGNEMEYMAGGYALNAVYFCGAGDKFKYIPDAETANKL